MPVEYSGRRADGGVSFKAATMTPWGLSVSDQTDLRRKHIPNDMAGDDTARFITTISTFIAPVIDTSQPVNGGKLI